MVWQAAAPLSAQPDEPWRGLFPHHENLDSLPASRPFPLLPTRWATNSPPQRSDQRKTSDSAANLSGIDLAGRVESDWTISPSQIRRSCGSEYGICQRKSQLSPRLGVVLQDRAQTHRARGIRAHFTPRRRVIKTRRSATSEHHERGRRARRTIRSAERAD